MKRFPAILLTVLAGRGPAPYEEGELAQTYRDLPGFEAATEGGAAEVR